jgi:hypothetical protein
MGSTNKGKIQKKIENPFSKLDMQMQYLWDYRIKNPIKRYLSLVEKEIRVLFKDRGAIIIAWGIPIVVILILTIGLNITLVNTSNSGSNLQSTLGNPPGELPRLGIVNLDDSEGFPNRDLSTELVDEFFALEEAGYCDLIISSSQSDLEIMLGEGKLTAFLIIPPLFEFNLSIHIPVILPFVLDTLDLLKMQQLQFMVDQVISAYKVKNGFTGVFKVEETNLNLPKNVQILFASSWIIFPSIIFGIGCLTATQSIVSDIPKDRMVLTPTNKAEMMAAKVTALQIIMLGVILIIIIGCVIVGFQILGSWLNFFFVLFIVSLNSVIIGVAISAISETSLSAFQYFIFIFLFQEIILIFVEDPAILMWMPIHNGAMMFMGIVLRGQNYYSVMSNIGSIFWESLGVYLLSYWVFKRQKTML